MIWRAYPDKQGRQRTNSGLEWTRSSDKSCIIAPEKCYRVYFLWFCINYDTRFSKYLTELIVALSSKNVTKTTPPYETGVMFPSKCKWTELGHDSTSGAVLSTTWISWFLEQIWSTEIGGPLAYPDLKGPIVKWSEIGSQKSNWEKNK